MATNEDESDFADAHVNRWRDHWIDIDFDDEVEAITVRIGRIKQYFKSTSQAAVRELGLHDFEYDTLHHLMIRDTPGQASPSELATDLGISGAGMTGRLDTMEKAGWVQREPGADDRRKVVVTVTDAGLAIWRRAMDLRGQAEDELLGELSAADRTRLAHLLKTLTLRIEKDENER